MFKNIFGKKPVQEVNPLQESVNKLEIEMVKAKFKMDQQAQLISAYQQMFEPNMSLKVFSYSPFKKQTFIITKEAPKKLWFELYIPELQYMGVYADNKLKPLADLCASTKDNKVTIEYLNVHPDHLNMRYGATLLSEVVSEVKSRGFKLIDGSFVLPNREEESLPIFLDGNFIGHVKNEKNFVLLKESKLV